MSIRSALIDDILLQMRGSVFGFFFGLISLPVVLVIEIVRIPVDSVFLHLNKKNLYFYEKIISNAPLEEYWESMQRHYSYWRLGDVDMVKHHIESNYLLTPRLNQIREKHGLKLLD